MRQLTQEQKERKAMFIARATRHYDTPEIRKEASDKWDEYNLPKELNWLQRLFKRRGESNNL